MEITYSSNKLEKSCNDFSNAKRVYGEQIAIKLHKRIEELKAATNLFVMSKIGSARLHELKGQRKGEYAVDLTGNYRLILTAADGKIELTKIETVEVKSVEDYH